MELHRGNNLAALATADFVVRIFDVETRRVVRVFQGHGGRVTDLVSDTKGKGGEKSLLRRAGESRRHLPSFLNASQCAPFYPLQRHGRRMRGGC